MPRIEIKDLPVRIDLEESESKDVQGGASYLLPYMDQDNVYKSLSATMQKVRETGFGFGF